MQHRALETPLQELTPIDEHSVEVDAPAEAAWAALFPTLSQTLDGRIQRRLSSWLDARDQVAEGDLHHPGGTLPNFVVARAVAPVMLALMGQHRFANYALVFRVDLLPGQRCRVRAETRALFPGAGGRLFKLTIIGGRIHVLSVRRILRRVRKRAEQRAAGH
ncbi:MAG TPA: hypothetical protein VKA36_06480 [Solirubrobacterales bacterium]|nr:hypothetical protein [Solirubrobacterales bacterium]